MFTHGNAACADTLTFSPPRRGTPRSGLVTRILSPEPSAPRQALLIGTCLFPVQNIILFVCFLAGLVKQGTAAVPDVTTAGMAVALMLSSVVVAPIAEIGFIALLHRFTRPWLGTGPYIAVTVALAAALHYFLLSAATAVNAAFLFLVFSIQYDLWRANRGPRTAFWGVVLTHAIYSALVTAMLTLTLIAGPDR